MFGWDIKNCTLYYKESTLYWESFITNATCWGSAVQKTTYSIRKNWVCSPKEARSVLSALRGCSETVSQSQTRVHRRNRWDKEGGIAHSISSAGSLRSPSLTGGPTSRVRPLPIQITLIGGSPLVYTCASYGTRKSGTEKEKARIPEWKKMGSNLARVNKKIGSWKRDGRRGMNRNFQIKRILLSITIIK